MNADPPRSSPQIEDLDDASMWITILHRRTVRDAADLNELRSVVAALRAPWWRRRRALRAADRFIAASRKNTR